jgi:phosphate transport system permease protein
MPSRRVSPSARRADRIAGIVLGVGGSFAPFALVSTMGWLLHQAWRGGGSGDWSRVLGWLRGSVALGVLALVAAAPFAIGGALLGRESERVRSHLRIAAAVPLAVPAFLFLHWTAPLAFRTLGVPALHPVWAGLALAIGMVPSLWLILSDALARGESLAPGAFALGASPSQVLRTLVIPASFPGLVAALLRGLSRALGETMAVLLVSGTVASAWGGSRDGAVTAGAALALELPRAAPGSGLWIDLMRAGLLLTALTVFVYAVSERIERRLVRQREAG